MVAGYSKRSLVEKLGIKEGSRIAFVRAPENYSRTLGSLPKGVTVREKPDGPLDLIQFFSMRKSQLESSFPALKKAVAQNGMLWVSWPKGSSKLETDLNENVVREIGLKNGLVDVKICAVDEVWSGLKFVYRRTDRK